MEFARNMAALLEKEAANDNEPAFGLSSAPPMPHILARECRDAALSVSWHAANVRAGYATDAARDLEEFHTHCAKIRDMKIAPASAAGHIENMLLHMAWHAANSRKSSMLTALSSGGFRRDAEKNQRDFDAAKAALLRDIFASSSSLSPSSFTSSASSSSSSSSSSATLVTLCESAVELLASMAASAAWYTANSRSRFSRDAKRDMAQLVRIYHSLFVARREKCK